MHDCLVTTRRVARRLAPALVLLLGLTACESASAPDEPTALDAQAVLQDYAAMQRVFGSDGMAGVRALSGRTPMSRASGAQAVTQLAALDNPQSARAFTASLFREMAEARRADAPAAIRVIANASRGRTYVYDPSIDNYRVDPTRTGAPSNGVRFVLYAVDATDRPIPSQEIGHADLLDEGPVLGEEIVLRLVAVERGRTVLDYRTRVVQLGEGSGRLEVNGFVVDGADRLGFTISIDGEDIGGVTALELDVSLRMESRGFAVTGTVRGVDGEDDGDGEVSLTVRHGAHTMELEVTTSSGLVDGEILLDGRRFVTLRGPQDNPTVLGPTGAPLTGTELLMVLQIVDVVDDVFDLIEDLLQPMDNLIVLGWIV